MSNLIKAIRDLLVDRINAIDAGTSKIDEETAMEIMEVVNNVTNKSKRISKYKACEMLHISRATFDNYVREGKLPRGEHAIGFKELLWSIKDIEDFKNKYWKDK